jgi:hypothetical protein
MAIDESPKDSNLNTDEINSNSTIQKHRGGARPGAGRPRKSAKVPLTKERRIEILESKISDPDISPRDLKSLSRELSLLKGESIPYDKRPVAERTPIAPPEPEEDLPTWWSEIWCRVFLIESLNGTRPIQRYAKELTRYFDSLSDEEKEELKAEAQSLNEARSK